MNAITVVSLFGIFLCSIFLIGGYTVIVNNSISAIVIYYLITGGLFLISVIVLILNINKECNQQMETDNNNQNSEIEPDLSRNYQQHRVIEEAVLYPQYNNHHPQYPQYLPQSVYPTEQQPTAPPFY